MAEEDYRKEILRVLMDLMRFKTLKNEKQELEKCADYIENYIKELGVEPKRIVNNEIISKKFYEKYKIKELEIRNNL